MPTKPLDLTELRRMVESMTPVEWEVLNDGARHAEDSESAATDSEGRKLFDTLNRDYRISETSRLDNDESGRWFDTGGIADITGSVALRNAASQLLAIAEAAQAVANGGWGTGVAQANMDALRKALEGVQSKAD